ncbi:adenylate/guanylate cyclase domain-containing protein [Prochlorothrix hollandica]|uniref:adenylate/guanylate cyclase domain-containing protein n=1 Tax=Prochlorothrix hollandica TaxID=1223 RepID=UPI0003473C19|nr:adenylate/guanylate cyclase domain-containing protein [Prochlorothrix hollandica]
MLSPFSRLAQFTGRFPLRTVLIVPIVVQILAVEAIVGYLSFRTAQRAVADLASQLRTEVTHHTLERLENYLTLPQIINQVNADAVSLGQLDTTSFGSMQRHFWHQSQQFPSVSYIYLGTPDGDIVGVERRSIDNQLIVGIANSTTQNQFYEYATDAQGELITPPQISPKVDTRTRPWYQAAIAAANPTWSPVYSWVGSDNQLSIDAVQRAYDAQGNFRGVLAVSLALLDISRFLETLDIGKTGEVYILDRQASLIATSAQDLVFNAHAEGSKAQRVSARASETPLIRQSANYLFQRFGAWDQIQSSAQYDVTLAGQRQFLQVTPLNQVRGIDWLVVVAVPEADFMEHIYGNVRSTLILSLVAVGGLVGGGVVIARWMSRPVQHLSEASHRLSQGQLDTLVPVGGSRELGILTHSFNQMAQQLRRSFTDLKTTNAALETANAALTLSNQDLEARVLKRTTELQQSEEKFATAFWKAPVPMAISTLETGEFLEANLSFAKVLGYEPQDLKHQSSLQLGLWRNPQDRERYIQILQTQGSLSQQQVELRMQGGEICLAEFSAEIIELQGQRRVLWMGQDVTERRKLEASRDYNSRCDRLLLEVSRRLLDQTQSLDRVLPSLLQQLGALTYSDRCFWAIVPTALSVFAPASRPPGPSPMPTLVWDTNPNTETLAQGLSAASALVPQTLEVQPLNPRRLRSPGDPLVIRGEWATETLVQPVADLFPSLPGMVWDHLWEGCQSLTGRQWHWHEVEETDNPGRLLLQCLHLRSLALVPLVYLDQTVGFLGVARSQGRQGWRSKDIQVLQLVGDVLAMTQARELAEQALHQEKVQSERLLLNILPQAIANQLKQDQRAIAESFADVTILFADIVGFTAFSAEVSPEHLVHWLNQVFSHFDTLAESFGLEKIKTVGDEYMVAAGLPLYRPDHAETIADMALAMADAMTYHPTPQGDRLQLRMGINTGAAVAGVIGIRKFIYDLWGDAVNVASRMESSGKPDRIQVSETTYQRLKDRYRFQKRRLVWVKGKGWMVSYWLLGKK